MATRNGFFWADFFANVFVPQIDILKECLIKKVLPSFDTIGKEAEEIEEKEFKRLCDLLMADDSGDMSEIAEKAKDKGVNYYVLMNDMKNNLVSLFCVALFHLFEQHIFMFYKKEILSPLEETNPQYMNWEQLLKRFNAIGIDLKSLNSYEDIDVIRLVTNTVKHGEGRSAEELRKIKSCYFIYERLDNVTSQDFVVPIEDFIHFAEKTKDFWKELAVEITKE